MGILFDKVKRSQDSLRQDYIAQLLVKGITHDRNGTSIHDLGYYELRQELAAAEFRNVNTETLENGFF
ncbi:hypothetical protein J7E38_13530 [Bacillus sp. ISL-35]|uniref:hypothetical protein n=1 Tax=Bacillus sp. ISL-35 TaxID=2819122 RepID=UPI001BE97F44|nr:hypothetical protein [Bacillus sp. ISL-35]MBT2680030.1 hypothetical protein [Bacillus sp. ISL-35]MBT2702993.1 hypothetical protein [Chryseobacterium sp. ISL-80]